jgi:hypothetical protein
LVTVVIMILNTWHQGQRTAGNTFDTVKLISLQNLNKNDRYTLVVKWANVTIQSFFLMYKNGRWCVNGNQNLYEIENEYFIVYFTDAQSTDDESKVEYMLISLEEAGTWNDKVKNLENNVEILQELLDKPGNAGAKYGYDQCAKLLQ